MIHIEDYEREAQKDLVYLQEDMHAFYQSLNDPGEAQIQEFLNQPQIEVIDLTKFKNLQETAKLNPSIPPSIIVKGDRRLLKYYERQVNALPF
jgi:hypothetical protein